MSEDFGVTLCNLEMIFPPAFFTITIDLVAHLPREAMLVGLMQYRWMYPIECLMGNSKRSVKNKVRPKRSIVEGYIENKCLIFCSQYLQRVKTVFNQRDHYNYDCEGELEVREELLDVFAQRN